MTSAEQGDTCCTACNICGCIHTAATLCKQLQPQLKPHTGFTDYNTGLQHPHWYPYAPVSAKRQRLTAALCCACLTQAHFGSEYTPHTHFQSHTHTLGPVRTRGVRVSSQPEQQIAAAAAEPQQTESAFRQQPFKPCSDQSHDTSIWALAASAF